MHVELFNEITKEHELAYWHKTFGFVEHDAFYEKQQQGVETKIIYHGYINVDSLGLVKKWCKKQKILYYSDGGHFSRTNTSSTSNTFISYIFGFSSEAEVLLFKLTWC